MSVFDAIQSTLIQFDSKNCRRLKMRCVGAENGPPCERCRNTNHECEFEESHRGKRSGKYQRTEAMAASLKKMEETLNSLINCKSCVLL